MTPLDPMIIAIGALGLVGVMVIASSPLITRLERWLDGKGRE